MKNAQSILTSILIAISGWNLLETVANGKAIAAMQVELSRKSFLNHEHPKSLAYEKSIVFTN